MGVLQCQVNVLLRAIQSSLDLLHRSHCGRGVKLRLLQSQDEFLTFVTFSAN